MYNYQGPFVFRDKIEEIFGKVYYYSENLSNYCEDGKGNMVCFSYGENTVTLQKLTQLSVLLGTERIDFAGKKETYELSEVTSDTSYEGEIAAFDVKIPVKKENG